MTKLKLVFAFLTVLAALVLNTSAQVDTTLGGGTSTRLDALESPKTTTIASNVTTAQIDFRQGVFQFTNGIATGSRIYEVKNLANALTLQLTNLVPGVVREVLITTDGTARNISISTNGITKQTRISYPLNLVTNGSYAMPVTNRARVNMLAAPSGEVEVTWTYFQ